eukprot:919118-Pelagomonas_calceolata.AAC.1
MGNSSSSSGEFLGADSTPPRGHDQDILAAAPAQRTEALQQNLQPPQQQHAPSQRPPAGTAFGLRQLVWNPFEMPNREHCPDLQQALAYDPEVQSSSSAPSIDELSRAQAEDFAAQALAQHQPPPASADAEAQCQAALHRWFLTKAATRVSGLVVGVHVSGSSCSMFHSAG